ncbi:hypothetical protein R6Q59_033985 [Mikania micrantha]
MNDKCVIGEEIIGWSLKSAEPLVPVSIVNLVDELQRFNGGRVFIYEGGGGNLGWWLLVREDDVGEIKVE